MYLVRALHCRWTCDTRGSCSCQPRPPLPLQPLRPCCHCWFRDQLYFFLFVVSRWNPSPYPPSPSPLRALVSSEYSNKHHHHQDVRPLQGTPSQKKPSERRTTAHVCSMRCRLISIRTSGEISVTAKIALVEKEIKE